MVKHILKNHYQSHYLQDKKYQENVESLDKFEDVLHGVPVESGSDREIRNWKLLAHQELELVDIFQGNTGSPGNGAQRIVGHVNREFRLHRNTLIQTAK